MPNRLPQSLDLLALHQEEISPYSFDTLIAFIRVLAEYGAVKNRQAFITKKNNSVFSVNSEKQENLSCFLMIFAVLLMTIQHEAQIKRLQKEFSENGMMPSHLRKDANRMFRYFNIHWIWVNFPYIADINIINLCSTLTSLAVARSIDSYDSYGLFLYSLFLQRPRKIILNENNIHRGAVPHDDSSEKEQHRILPA